MRCSPARASRKATMGDHAVEAVDREREVGPLTVIAMVKGAVPGFLGPTGRGGERVEARCGARGRRPVTEK